jgi:CheY-like chemotaxis protein
MRILIAEDDVTSRTVLAGVLKKGGHEVVEAVDGAAVLRRRVGRQGRGWPKAPRPSG